EEARDPSVGTEADEAVAGRIGDRRQQDRRLRAAIAMELDEPPEVGSAQRVAVQREEASDDPARCEADRAAGAERLVLGAVLERETVRVVAEVFPDLRRKVAARERRAHDAVPAQMLECEREQR